MLPQARRPWRSPTLPPLQLQLSQLLPLLLLLLPLLLLLLLVPKSRLRQKQPKKKVRRLKILRHEDMWVSSRPYLLAPRPRL